MGEDDAPLEQASAWTAAGRRVALATVVGTWGSSPRPPGSLLAVADDGAFVGSVSGGCIEGAVVDEALAVMADGKPRLLDFGITDERAWEVGLACGGEMKVFVAGAPDPKLLETLLAERPVALVTHLKSGKNTIVTEQNVSGDLALDTETIAAARDALHEDRSRPVQSVSGPLFIAAFNPPARMVIVGAVHIAQVLAPMAAMAGFQVTVVDPRRAFATEARFPGVSLSHDWPDDALAARPPDSRTAVVTLSHDPKLDDPALEAALRSPGFYIGALGSQKTQAGRRQRLQAAGFGREDLERICGPVGLDLGGRRAAEIAVAILAQVVAARNGRPHRR